MVIGTFKDAWVADLLVCHPSTVRHRLRRSEQRTGPATLASKKCRRTLPGVRGASHAHVGHAGQTACLTSRVQLGDECGDLARHLAGHFQGRQMALTKA